MIDLGLFQSQLFTLGSGAALLSFVAISVNAFLLPFYLQLILGYPPSQAGILMTPTSLAIVVVAPFSGWLSDRLGARLLASFGLFVVCLALLSLSRLDAASGYHDVVLRLVLLGIGQGMFQSPNSQLGNRRGAARAIWRRQRLPGDDAQPRDGLGDRYGE